MIEIPISILCPFADRSIKWPIQTNVIKNSEKEIKQTTNFQSFSPCASRAIVRAKPSGKWWSMIEVVIVRLKFEFSCKLPTVNERGIVCKNIAIASK